MLVQRLGTPLNWQPPVLLPLLRCAVQLWGSVEQLVLVCSLLINFFQLIIAEDIPDLQLWVGVHQAGNAQQEALPVTGAGLVSGIECN